MYGVSVSNTTSATADLICAELRAADAVAAASQSGNVSINQLHVFVLVYACVRVHVRMHLCVF